MGQRVHVVAGVLSDELDRILIADRARASTMCDYWEFPGGKVKVGEDAEAALCRELQEELGIKIAGPQYFRSVRHDYAEIRVDIDFFLVNQWDGEVSSREGQALQWVLCSELHNARLLPADTPVIKALQKLSRCSV